MMAWHLPVPRAGAPRVAARGRRRTRDRARDVVRADGIGVALSRVNDMRERISVRDRKE
jgi:hypothetical protein